MAVKKKSMASRVKELKEITNGFNKVAGKNIINTVSDPEMAEKIRIEYIPTASLKLNVAIAGDSKGGWPRGKFSLISGKSDAGKTYRLLEDISYNQKIDPEFIALWIESESSLDPEAFEMFGIDKERFYYFEVGTYGGEKALDLAIRYAQGGVDMIVINSLKCLTPNEEFTKNMDESTVALQARMNAKFMRIIIPTIAESGTALCIVQHMSTNIGGGPRAGSIIVGGLALKYNNVLTIEFAKGFIDSKHPLAAIKDLYMPIKATIKKNHCRTTVNPYTTVEYMVKLGIGTDITGEIIEEAIRQKIIVKGGGGWFREYNDGIEEKDNERILEDGTKCSWRGLPAFNEFIDKNPDYFEYLKDRVSGNIQVDNVSEEDIEKYKSEEDIEKEAIEDLEKALQDYQ